MNGSKFRLCVAVCAAVFVAGSALAKTGERGPRIAFEQLDANGDGEITRQEAESFRSQRFAKTDTNGDGFIDLQELTAEASSRAARKAEQMMQRMDSDGDGLLSEDDLAQGPRAGRMFDRLDRDNDGTVTKAEFEEAKARAGQRWREKNRSE